MDLAQDRKESALAGTNEHNELTLADMAGALYRYKFLIVVLAVAGLLVAAALMFLTPAIYESRAVIQVGRIGQTTAPPSMFIEEPVVLAERLKTEYAQMTQPYHLGAEVSGRVGLANSVQAAQLNILEIKLNAPDPLEARDLLDRLVAQIIDRHADLYAEGIALNKKEQDNIDGALSELRRHLSQLDQQLESVSQKGDSVTASMLVPQLGEDEG